MLAYRFKPGDRISALLLQHRLRRSEARRRHAERRARHVVHAHLHTELDAARLAAVLAADADLQLFPRRTALADADLDDLADADLIEHLERVLRQDLQLAIFRD